jgi:hypothetical protein
MSRRVVRLSSGLVLFTYKTHAAPYTFEHRHPQIGFEQQDPGQSSPDRKCARSSISWSLSVLDTLLIVPASLVRRPALVVELLDDVVTVPTRDAEFRSAP